MVGPSQVLHNARLAGKQGSIWTFELLPPLMALDPLWAFVPGFLSDLFPKQCAQDLELSTQHFNIAGPTTDEPTSSRLPSRARPCPQLLVHLGDGSSEPICLLPH